MLPRFVPREPTIAGVSGGRTSALMHVLSLAAMQEHGRAGAHLYVPCFANTGKEHEGTLLFLHRIAEATQVPIRWVEFVAPPPGSRPREATFRDVDFATAARNGEPFEAFLEMLASFRRETKGQGPVAPSARARLCTAYMKIKIKRHVARAWGEDEDGEDWIGLRADEPARVSRMSKNDRGNITTRAPLAEAGLSKADVLAFWRVQPFDLDIPEHQGNCTKCFLKDEADLARSMYEDPSDVGWWLDIQARYGVFRPRDRVSYGVIAAEAPTRMEVVVPAVARGEDPVCPAGFDPRRFFLIVKQEQRRLRAGASSFSCACESVQQATDDDLEGLL